MNLMKRWISLTVCMVMMLTAIPNAHAAENQPELRNLAKEASYEWSEAPESSYPDPGNKLTDGKIGGLNVLDPAWVGSLHKTTREIVLDLGERKSISSVKAHFLQDWPSSAILFPLTVSVYVSDDKEHWGTIAHRATEHLWVDGPPVDQYYVWDGSKDGIPTAGSDAVMAYARYVKVTFSMHPRAWSFIDEIEVWGADGKAEGAKSVPSETFHYLQPGEPTAGIRNLSLIYNGYYSDVPKLAKDNLIPEIGYVNKEGKLADWFFDGVLMLGLQTPQGHDFGNGEANLSEWKWYLDKTFDDQGDMYQVNEATKEVGEKLGQPEHKVKVVMMIPNPGEHLSNFGDVDGDGVSENFNAGEVGEEAAMANRQKAVRWWIQEVMQRWNTSSYSNLELVGLYWLDEQVSTSKSGPEFLRFVNGLVHDQGLKAFWIPHFLSYKSFMWKDVGFDSSAFQPNYYFEELNMDRLKDAANIAKRYGMGVELEFDDRMLKDKVFRKRFLEYLDAGEQFGFKDHAYKAYYKGSGTILHDAAASKDPEIREVYDKLYQFAKGSTTDNKAPVAADAAFSTAADTPISGKLAASGADGDALAYSIVENGAKGKAEITDASTGAFTYTPNAGQTGTDTFTFKANNGKADSNIAKITVTIGSMPVGVQTVLAGASSVPSGEKFTVTYGLTGVTQAVYGQDIRLDYDSAFMEFVSAKSVMDRISLVEIDKKTAGKLRVIMASQGAGHAVTGNAELVEFTFKAKKDAQSTTGVISISSAVLGDEQGTETQATPSSKTIQITVKIPGDYNGDGKVTVGDLGIVAAHYGKTKQSPDWEEVKHMDVNRDGKIDIQDLAAVARIMLK
ncbi:DUF4855 domain-containing protein [Paenibacillus sp. MER TA 81-3]|uniref:DUF4855 domain-containing protein n=1 Tax=Paenibacillus sp. MER TA 81-3 TaxID=2939573 RepID=UPI0020407837|nr:DUF4855 domain-containing protein [Paenibacillus sp. MER TA 81-3]MCM3340570.1 DUF4855 domain-containing protein [Paenibacillus sp. MER TA 81-3]